MVKLYCSKLEEIRRDPVLYGKNLALELNSTGGYYGMFAHWQNVSIKLHKDCFSQSQGILELQNAFLRFAVNPKNKIKQEFLYRTFIHYHTSFLNNRFEFVNTWKNFIWEISSFGKLAGRTPIIEKKESKYYAYFFTEEPVMWKSELKFPLLQKIITTTYLKCNSTELFLGTYCLSSNEFQFINYSEMDVNKSVAEVRKLIYIVNLEYHKSIKLKQ